MKILRQLQNDVRVNTTIGLILLPLATTWAQTVIGFCAHTLLKIRKLMFKSIENYITILPKGKVTFSKFAQIHFAI